MATTEILKVHEFIIPNASDNPADLVHNANSVLDFLKTVLHGYRGELPLAESESYGLTLILDGIQYNLNKTLEQL